MIENEGAPSMRNPLSGHRRTMSTPVIVLAILLPGTLGAVEHTEESVLREFRAWAERITKVPSIHFDFTSIHEPIGDGHPNAGAEILITRTYFWGHVDLDIQYGRVYMEYSQSEALVDPTAVPQYFSWGDGSGYALKVDPDAEHQRVLKSPQAPVVLGRAHLPTNHPLFPGLRSLASFLESRRVRVERIPESDGLFRIAVAMGSKEDEIPPSWYVYHVDPASDGKIVEQRIYFNAVPDLPVFSAERPPVPHGFHLPEDYHANYLHLRKLFRQFRSIGDVAFPVEWEVELTPMDGRALVSIDDESLVIGRLASHGYRPPLSNGDRVTDINTRMTFVVEDSNSPVTGESEISEADLERILLQAGLPSSARVGVERDLVLPSGCSANCVYIVLSSLKKPAALSEIIAGLGIRAGDAWINLYEVSSFLRDRGVKSAVIGGGNEWLRSLGSVPAIVHRESSLGGHFFTARDYRDTDDTLQIIDPPRSVYRQEVNAIRASSSGTILIVDPVVLESLDRKLLSEKVRSRLYLIAGGALLLGVVLCAVVGWLRKRQWKYGR